MVVELTGMEIANASMLDEATAAAEAMAMARRVSKTASMRFLVDADCHPETIAVVKTRARYFDFEIDEVASAIDEGDFFGVLVQYPGSSSTVRDYIRLIDTAHDGGALVTVASDLLGLVLLKSLGAMGADIVVGNAQRFGVPMGYGGPHAAFYATRKLSAAIGTAQAVLTGRRSPFRSSRGRTSSTK